MKISIDINSLKAYSTTQSASPITRVDVKRGDTLPLDITFVNKKVPVLLDASVDLEFTAKLPGSLSGSALVFTPAADFTVTGPSTKATGTVDCTSSAVSSLTITGGGSGYTSVPTVVFSGGGGSGAAATVEVENSGIESVTLTNGGIGYANYPRIAITAGSGAILAAVRTGTVVTSITITNGGSGYLSPPLLTFAAPNSGARATATAVLTDGVITGFIGLTGGTDYIVDPAITVTPLYNGGASADCLLLDGEVNSISVTSAGSGFLTTPTITVVGGNGTSATATATLEPGYVRSLNVLTGGTLYEDSPLVTIDGDTKAEALVVGGAIKSIHITDYAGEYTEAPSVSISGAGTGATASAVYAPPEITGIVLTSGGGGYYVAPHVRFVGGGGSGAVGKASVANGVVTSVDVINQGSGYTSAPIVELVGGSGSGATAYCTLASKSVQYLQLTNGGSGYDALPTVAFTGGTAITPATAVPQMVGTGVGGIEITNGGSYSVAPTAVTVTGSGMSGFTGTPIMSPAATTGATQVTRGSGFTDVPVVEFTGGGSPTRVAKAELIWEMVPTGVSKQVTKYRLRGATSSTQWNAPFEHVTVSIRRIIGSGTYVYDTLALMKVEPSDFGYSVTQEGDISQFVSEYLTKYGYDRPSELVLKVFARNGNDTVQVYLESMVEPGEPIFSEKATGIRITDGGEGYGSTPTVTISGPYLARGYSNVTASCLIQGGQVVSASFVGEIQKDYLPFSVTVAINDGSNNLYSATIYGAKIDADGGVVIPSFDFGQLTGPQVLRIQSEFVYDYTSKAVFPIAIGDLHFEIPARYKKLTSVMPTFTAMTAPRSVVGVTVTAAGTGYTKTTPVTITPAVGDITGSGATAHVVKSGGKVTSLVLTNPGSGYTSPPVVTIGGGTGAGSGATAVAVMAPSSITGVVVQQGGSGYLPPTATISGTGTGATADVLAVDGRVIGVNLTNAGSGYTGTPTITITPPATQANANATATAVLDGSTVLRVSKVVVNDWGSGYFDVPTVELIGGDGSGALATAKVSPDGRILSINVTSPGSGYTTAPAVVITRAALSVATGTVTLLPGRVTAINVTSGGSGYDNTPYLTFSGGGGTGAAGFVTVASGAVTAVHLTSPGSGYSTAPTAAVTSGVGSGATVAVTHRPASLKSITVTDGGSGYVETIPTVSFVGGGGSGAKATPVMLNGALVDVVVTSPGTGYTSVPTMVVSSPTGTGAEGVVTLTPKAVKSITLTNPGSGYSSAPDVSIVGGDGAGASVTATLGSPGVVTGVTITDGGQGYLTAPTATFSLPTTTARRDRATGIVNMGESIVSSVSITNGGNNYEGLPTVVFSDPPFGYSSEIDLTSSALSVALGSLDYLDLQAEVTAIYPGDKEATSASFILRVHNDVNKGSESAPV